MKTHLATVALLLLVVLFGHYFSMESGLGWIEKPWLLGLGIMILLAYSTGEILRRLGLPTLLGYIAVGIFLGPGFAALVDGDFPLTIISEEVIQQLGLVQVLIIGLIGILGGAKLKVSDLEGNRRLVFAIVVALFLVVLPVVILGIFLGAQLFPSAMVFFVEQSLSTQITMALFFAILSVGLAPSVTVAMLQDLRARGPLTALILGVVIFAEFVLFVLFAIALSVGRALTGPEIPEWSVFAGLLPGVGGRILLAIGLGVGLGIVIANYFRYVRKETLLFLLALLLVGYFGVVYLDAEPLLTFLVAGFFVQNATRQGDSLVRMLERVALPVFVVYFALLAADIDLVGLAAYIPLVLLLVGLRSVGMYWAIRWASQGAVATNRTYEYLRTSFLSQDAVVLVLASVVALYFPEWGTAFQSVIVATVVTYLVIGPIYLNVALDRSGEARQSGVGARDEAELAARAIDLSQEKIELEKAFTVPDFEDAWLKGHVEDLREGLKELASTCLLQPTRKQSEELHRILQELGELFSSQEEGLQLLVEKLEEKDGQESVGSFVRELQRGYARQMQPLLERLEAVQGLSLHSESLQDFLEKVRGLEDKDSLYKIEREANLLRVRDEDTPAIRLLKRARQLRVKVSGRGYRNVPVGQLWRYYLELALPAVYASNISVTMTHYERFWKGLWRHLRDVDAFWERLIEGSNMPSSEEHEEVGTLRREQTAEQIKKMKVQARVQRDDLHEEVSIAAKLVERHFLLETAERYNQFVRATARAGTSRLPAFMHRPSSRFGQARRGENRLLDRVQRAEGIIAGYRGWIRLDHELASFSQWARLFGAQIDETVDRTLGLDWEESIRDLQTAISEAIESCKSSEDQGLHCEEIFLREIRPRVLKFRKRQEELLARVHKGLTTRGLQHRLDARIAKVPERISILVGEPERVVLTSVSNQLEIPLRTWLATQVSREVALRIVEFNDRAEGPVQQRLATLSSVEQILEFNLVRSLKEDGLQKENRQPGETTLELTLQGLERAIRQLDVFLEKGHKTTEELRSWLSKELLTIVDEAFEPLRSRRLGEVQRKLARQEAATLVARGESLLSEALEPLTKRWASSRSLSGNWLSELGAELGELLHDQAREVDRFEIRKILFAGETLGTSEAPSIYRRLFLPSTLDIPEFYRHREEAEDRFLETLRDFLGGKEQALLITGQPGVGKRTFVHHLLPGRLQATESGILKEDQIRTVLLSASARGEANLAAMLSEAVLQGPPARDLEELTQRLRRSRRERQIVVVERTECALLRTEEGLELFRRFMAMMEQTASKVLWILLLNEGAATFLDTHLGFRSFFTHWLHLKTFSAEELEKMILSRHQVSGYELDFEPPSLGRLKRLRYPLLGARARQLPQRIFFERLAHRSGGNPRAALLYWLKAIAPDPINDSRIIVRSLADRDVRLLSALSLEQKVILAILCLHRRITIEGIAAVLLKEKQAIALEIRQLERLGFCEFVEDTHDEYRIRPIASAWVERELQALNLI